MESWNYEDYDDYLSVQKSTNKRKSATLQPTWSWCRPTELAVMSYHIMEHIPMPRNGICHGVRTGAEVRLLREFLDSDVIGTDLATNQFADVVVWDFHDENPEWMGKMDFVYSNAFDHAFSPQRALRTWMSQLTSGGKCYIHWGWENFKVNRPNCFGCQTEELLDFVKACGFKVFEVIETNIDKRVVVCVEAG